MVIVHKISDLLFELFPKAKAFGKDTGILKEELQAYYSFGPYHPEVSITSEFIEITIDVPAIINQKPEFDKAIALCEKQKFVEAKKILENLIKQNPSVSEYHRVLGQIYSDEGNQDEAINCMIDALKWNPKNRHALIMMGNIFAKHKNDIDTASKYYNEAIAHSPDDFIAINNLGRNLIMIDKWEEGLKYLEAAYEINPEYPQTNYGIGLVNDHFGNTLVAFEYAISCLKKCRKQDQNLFNQALALVKKTSEQWVKTDIGKKLFNEYKSHLEKKGNKEIKVEVDVNIHTPAKIEFAENYNRDYHLIRCKENYLAVEHLMMHELVHLDFALDAKKENSNMLFISGGDKKNLFIKDFRKTIEKLNKDGFSNESVAGYMNAIFEGMNRQIFNAPIDLFIEDFLHENYRELKPYQFISLYGHLNEGIIAVTDARGVKITPPEILSASKVLNVVHAIHFKNLFGLDVISKFKPTVAELNESNRL